MGNSLDVSLKLWQTRGGAYVIPLAADTQFLYLTLGAYHNDLPVVKSCDILNMKVREFFRHSMVLSS